MASKFSSRTVPSREVPGRSRDQKVQGLKKSKEMHEGEKKIKLFGPETSWKVQVQEVLGSGKKGPGTKGPSLKEGACTLFFLSYS